MGAPEDVALYGLRVSLGSILEGFGFATITDDSLDILSDVMKRFMFNLSTKGKFYSEHAGRSDTSVSDLNLAFKRMKFCTTEFSNFLANNVLAPVKLLPKFPVQKQQVRPLYHPQPSERELEARPEYIPAFLQAAHPEWTRDGADYLAVMKPSTSGEKKGTAPDFPLFAANNSHSLGIGKDDRRPPPPIITRTDDSSATGIKSSANIASQKLYNPDYAAQLIKKKNRPLNGLKESRSNTPINRSYSPYELEERNHSRTDSPNTSRSAEKVKFKPRPPSSASRHAQQESAKNEQSTSSAIEAGSLAGMPKLEMIETDSKSFDEDTNDIETPPRCNEDLINQNILLFQQLKQQQERYEQDKVVKENLKLEKAKKKIEQKEKKREENRLYREKKKLEKEEHKRKLKESRKEAQQRQIQKKAEAEAQNERDAQQKLALILEAQKVKSVSQPPLKIIEEQKPLKLVITKPKHTSASSAFSPSPAPPSTHEHTPPPIIPGSKHELVNEDTKSYYGTSDVADMTHSFNASFDETPKKKKKKKDKDRDRSPSSHKKHKKDKEHKKKKKEKREKEERERASFNLFDREPKNEPEQKPLTLKIKLGEHAASAGDGSGVEPVKFKFRLVPPEKKEEEKVAPLRLPLIRTPGSSEKKHKQEKTSKFTPEKEEKMRKKEEKKRKEREEAEQRQRAEYERIHREHEEKQKREKEAEEKRKREEETHHREKEQREKEQRENEETERRKEKEKARKMEKELAHINATTELLFKQERKEKPTQPPVKVRTQDDDDEEDEKIWICPTCHVAWTEGANMVACDQCNNWFHWHCVGLLIAPQEDIPWYCKKCSRKPLKRPFKSSAEIPKKKKKSSEGLSFVK